MVVVTRRSGDYHWSRFAGRDEAAQQPSLAAESDQDLTVWRESRQVSWACNTMILTTIRNRLSGEVEP